VTLLSLLAALLGAGPGAKASPVPEPQPHLAFVLLETPAMPAGERVVAAFREIAPAAESPVAVEPGSDASSLQLAVGRGGSLLVSLMPIPVPGREAEEAFAFSYSAGLDADGELAPHRAHLVVYFKDEPGRSRYEGLTRFTYLLAALVEASRATAVYWGDAGATHEARFFVERARKRDPDLMLPLWSGVELVQEGPDRASALSLGMRRQLGVMELRITAPQRNLGDHVLRMYDLLAYAARRGSAVADGETIGRSATERLKVRHERSPADPEQKVWRVDFP
jgi:hypothetical protein